MIFIEVLRAQFAGDGPKMRVPWIAIGPEDDDALLSKRR